MLVSGIEHLQPTSLFCPCSEFNIDLQLCDLLVLVTRPTPDIQWLPAQSLLLTKSTNH